jgi:ketosteroid isomerase-like protein
VPLMASDPSSTVQAVIDANNARDLDALLALFHDEVVWHTTPGFLWPGPYRGRDALRGLFEHWWQGWDTGRADVREESERDGDVLLSADFHGRSAGSGEDVHVLLHWILSVRDGRVFLVRSYETVDEARAAL